MNSIHIDMKRGVVTVEGESDRREHPIDTPEAFEAISQAWLRCGWDIKHVYSFTWLGRPIIQLPEDLVRLQELIYRIKPQVIIETGVAHGGSLIFSAMLLKAMGGGLVIGVDCEIRPHNRAAIEEHDLASMITMIEGDSIDPKTVSQVRDLLPPNQRIMVLLDSCHTKDHVLAELRAYSPFVSFGSYIIAMDGIMQSVVGAPRTEPDWEWNNPRQAAREFVRETSDFEIVEPPFAFNEGAVRRRVTYWPDGIIQRVR